MLIIDGLFYFLIIGKNLLLDYCYSLKNATFEVLIETRILYFILEMMRDKMPGYYKYQVDEDEEPLLDEDVSNEQKRVSTNFDTFNDVLRVFGLKKKFRRLRAVKDVSFGVKTGECFGLLGINGAGKTTTFRMLTGDETPSSGDAEIFSTKLTQSRRKFLSQIGYCPQFDSIIPELTGRELLTLMGRVRGVELNQVESEVNR